MVNILTEKNARMQKLMGDEGGGPCFFSTTDPKCLCGGGVLGFSEKSLF